MMRRSFIPLLLLFLGLPVTGLAVIEIGTPGATSPTIYYFKKDISMSTDWKVRGPVIIVLGAGFNSTGREIDIAPDAKLTIYVAEDFLMKTGSTFNNRGLPKNLKIFGTAPVGNSQDILVAGKAGFWGTIYAPRADVVLASPSGLAEGHCGSIISEIFNFNGSHSHFHFDLNLAREILWVDPDKGESGLAVNRFEIKAPKREEVVVDGQTRTVIDYIASQF